MSREQIVLITLVAYALVLILIGFWASRRTRSADDFFIGGRALGATVASISASASSSSAWTLLGVSGAAFAWGLPALWLFPATLLGFVVNWFWVAPRIMPLARGRRAVTVSDILAEGAPVSMQRPILRSAAVVIIFSFAFYIASQFQAAGNAFAETFSMDADRAIMVGGLIVIIYTYAGGFWAVSVTDTLQGLLMAITAIVLPIGALLAVGGFEGLLNAATIDTSPGDGQSAIRMATAPAALGFVLGTLGIGLGYPGQPHVVNRLMALRDETALRRGKVVAVTWAVIVYSGMIVLGLCGRVLAGTLPDGEQVFFALANALHSPVISGLMIAAVLSAVMSTADSQLLVAASSASHDWKGGVGASEADSNLEGKGRLRGSRMVALVLSLLAVALAIVAPATIFDRVLFAWHAIGSAFGPLLLLILAGFRINPKFVLASIWLGFGATVILHWFPDTPGDWLERLIPFALAGIVALMGGSKPKSHV